MLCIPSPFFKTPNLPPLPPTLYYALYLTEKKKMEVSLPQTLFYNKAFNKKTHNKKKTINERNYCDPGGLVSILGEDHSLENVKLKILGKELNKYVAGAYSVCGAPDTSMCTGYHFAADENLSVLTATRATDLETGSSVPSRLTFISGVLIKTL